MNHLLDSERDGCGKCDFSHVYGQSFYYIIAIANGCLSCIKKYKTQIDLCHYVSRRKYVCLLHHTYVCQCGSDYKVRVDDFYPITRVDYYGFYVMLSSYYDRNVNIDKEQIIDVLCELKKDVPYSISRLGPFIEEDLFPLTYIQIFSLLIAGGFSPRDRFWTRYTKKYMKTIIRIKWFFTEADYVNKKQRRHILRQITPIVDNYVSTKVNLHIMKRKNLLCDDAAELVESFVM